MVGLSSENGAFVYGERDSRHLPGDADRTCLESQVSLIRRARG